MGAADSKQAGEEQDEGGENGEVNCPQPDHLPTQPRTRYYQSHRRALSRCVDRVPRHSFLAINPTRRDLLFRQASS
jgi:hypothetical protein